MVERVVSDVKNSIVEWMLGVLHFKMKKTQLSNDAYPSVHTCKIFSSCSSLLENFYARRFHFLDSVKY